MAHETRRKTWTHTNAFHQGPCQSNPRNPTPPSRNYEGGTRLREPSLVHQLRGRAEEDEVSAEEREQSDLPNCSLNICRQIQITFVESTSLDLRGKLYPIGHLIVSNLQDKVRERIMTSVTNSKVSRSQILNVQHSSYGMMKRIFQ